MSDGATFARGKVLGRYVVLEQLGQGGMGVVYLAYDPDLERNVALKLLRPVAGMSEESMGRRRVRLQREAKAMARLSHPNVVSVHDLGVAADQQFVAMELVDGATLRRWLARGPRPWREVLRAFIGAGRGLAAAHDAGLVHRDFKPENVLIDERGVARVTDFGLAFPASASERAVAAAADGTRTGAVIGTLAYLAPEVFRGEPADERSDQFSFCVSLYEGLYLQHPFALPEETDETVSLFDAVALEVVQGRVREPAPGTAVPGWLRRVLLRGLAVDPVARWPSMHALLAALERGPRVKGRHIGAALAVVGAALLLWSRPAAPSVCRGFEQRLDGVWDRGARAATLRAFLDTGVPRAAASWLRAAAALDDYTGRWVAMRGDACRATAVRREQSSAVLDLRMQCLDRRLGGVSALVAVYARADVTIVDRAVGAALSLRPLADCADTAALGAAVPPPRDPAARARAQALRGRIDAATALHRAGKERAAYLLSGAATEEARASGLRALEAEALEVHASLAVDFNAAGAEDLIRAGLAAAADAHADATVVELLDRMVWLKVRAARVAEALALRPPFDAVVRRAGDETGLRARFHRAFGEALSEAGRYTEALPDLERALALDEIARGPEAYTLVKTLYSLSLVEARLGRVEAARGHLERGLGILARTVGPEHPAVASLMNELGTLSLQGGHFEEALRRYQQTLAIVETAFGEQNSRTAVAMQNVALALGRLRRFAESRALLARALAAREALFGREHPLVAQTLINMGELAADEGRVAEAVPLLERALGILEGHGRSDDALLASANRTLGEILVDNGAPGKARAHFDRALAIDATTLPDDHILRVRDRAGLAQCDLAAGRTADAVAALERAWAVYRGNEDEHDGRSRVARALAQALRATHGDPARVAALEAEAR